MPGGLSTVVPYRLRRLVVSEPAVNPPFWLCSLLRYCLLILNARYPMYAKSCFLGGNGSKFCTTVRAAYVPVRETVTIVSARAINRYHSLVPNVSLSPFHGIQVSALLSWSYDGIYFMSHVSVLSRRRTFWPCFVLHFCWDSSIRLSFSFG